MPEKFFTHKAKYLRAKIALVFEPKWRQITLVFAAFMLLFAGFGQLVFVKDSVVMPSNTRADSRSLFGTVSRISNKDYSAVYGGNIDKELDMIQASGSKWVRLNLSMEWSEPQKGTFDENYLSQVDSVIAKAITRNMNVLFVTDGSPIWANSGSKGYPPTNPQDYADWLKVLVNRYKTLGVHAWEVWNEPNLPKFWGGTPNATQYVELLKRGYTAIKSADPSATVISAGLAQGNSAIDPVKFLKDMYNAGLKSYCDKVAFHPYTNAYSPDTWWADHPYDTFPVTKNGIRQVMIDNGDDAKSIWITEMGYSTFKNADGSIGPYGIDESAQATYLKRAYEKVASEWPFVELMFWYEFRNPTPSSTTYEDNLGIVNNDYSTKLAYSAYRQAADAFFANVAYPTPIPTPSSSPISTLYEAESASLVGVTVANNQTGYAGSGFVDFVHITNDFVEWTISDKSADQNYNLIFRYANGDTSDRSLKLLINDVSFGNISFLSTGAWTNWQYATINVPFNESVNHIKLVAVNQGGPNLDNLKIETTSVSNNFATNNNYGFTIQAKLLNKNTLLNCVVGSSNGFGGTTFYSVFSTSPINTNLSAPKTCGNYKFIKWSTGNNKTALDISDSTTDDNPKIYTIYYK